MSASLEPTSEQMAALAARPADAPVVMVNLLKFRADGGRASYARYGQEVVPHLHRVGGKVLYAGGAPTQVIGDGEKPWWDAILVVEYPSPVSVHRYGDQRGIPQDSRVPGGRTRPWRPDRHGVVDHGRLVMYLVTGAGGGIGSVSRGVVELLLDDGQARPRDGAP